jgi:hypothetical protein
MIESRSWSFGSAGQTLAASIGIAAVLIGAAPAMSAPDDSRPEPPEMVTDRPDATESAVVVPRGYYQFELGWTHSEYEDEGIKDVVDSFPELLVRIGLSRRVELRAGFDGYEWEEVGSSGTEIESREGITDTNLGVKVGLFEEKGALPQMAVLATLNFPTGAEEFTESRVLPELRMAFSNTLTERLSLGYNVGAFWFKEERADGTETTSSSAIWSVSLGVGITEWLSGYVEALGNPVLSALGSTSSAVDGGLTYLVRPNIQLDLAGGTGISGDAPDWFAGLGVSFRVPRLTSICALSSCAASCPAPPRRCVVAPRDRGMCTACTACRAWPAVPARTPPGRG